MQNSEIENLNEGIKKENNLVFHLKYKKYNPYPSIFLTFYFITFILIVLFFNNEIIEPYLPAIFISLIAIFLLVLIRDSISFLKVKVEISSEGFRIVFLRKKYFIKFSWQEISSYGFDALNNKPCLVIVPKTKLSKYYLVATSARKKSVLEQFILFKNTFEEKVNQYEQQNEQYKINKYNFFKTIEGQSMSLFLVIFFWIYLLGIIICFFAYPKMAIQIFQEEWFVVLELISSLILIGILAHAYHRKSFIDI